LFSFVVVVVVVAVVVVVVCVLGLMTFRFPNQNLIPCHKNRDFSAYHETVGSFY
jgi:hypothetical protein